MSLGSLSGGRIAFTDGAMAHLRNALAIAIRFACGRRQFSPPEEKELPIWEYPLT
jgi:hypothetical protein